MEREKAGLGSLTRRHIWRMNDACVASGHEKQLKGNLLEGGEKRERFLFRNGKLTVCYFSDSLKLYLVLSSLSSKASFQISRFLSHSKALSFSSSNLLLSPSSVNDDYASQLESFFRNNTQKPSTLSPCFCLSLHRMKSLSLSKRLNRNEMKSIKRVGFKETSLLSRKEGAKNRK